MFISTKNPASQDWIFFQS